VVNAKQDRMMEQKLRRSTCSMTRTTTPFSGVWPGRPKVSCQQEASVDLMHTGLQQLLLHRVGYVPSKQSPTLVIQDDCLFAGSMLVLPAGMHKTSADDQGINAAFVYARGKWNAPVIALPASKVLCHMPVPHFLAILCLCIVECVPLLRGAHVICGQI
jgi:hypothetical protein